MFYPPRLQYEHGQSVRTVCSKLPCGLRLAKLLFARLHCSLRLSLYAFLSSRGGARSATVDVWRCSGTLLTLASGTRFRAALASASLLSGCSPFRVTGDVPRATARAMDKGKGKGSQEENRVSRSMGSRTTGPRPGATRRHDITLSSERPRGKSRHPSLSFVQLKHSYDRPHLIRRAPHRCTLHPRHDTAFHNTT